MDYGKKAVMVAVIFFIASVIYTVSHAIMEDRKMTSPEGNALIVREAQKCRDAGMKFVILERFTGTPVGVQCTSFIE